jgi:DNA-binding XRE family transcriptional regulator
MSPAAQSCVDPATMPWRGPVQDSERTTDAGSGQQRSGTPARALICPLSGALDGHSVPAMGARDDADLPVLPGFREIALRRRELIAGLTAVRRDAGLSQADVAERMGTAQSVVARLESGELDVRLSTLQRYASAVSCELRAGSVDGGGPS